MTQPGPDVEDGQVSRVRLGTLEFCATMNDVCTLTWHDVPDGYAVFFNRDERRQRKAEIPPAVRQQGATRFVAPLDGDFGGTWIAVNEFGLSVCVLNGFPARPGAAGKERGEFTSRGLLPISMIESPCARSAAEVLHGLELERFRPFMLVLLEPDDGGMLASWSGDSLSIAYGRPAEQILVSSSFFTEEVRKSRVAVFRGFQDEFRGAEPTEMHLAYHRCHRPCVGPYSPCMHREDAGTVSFTYIRVDARGVRLHYAPNAPCRGVSQDLPLSLERRRAIGREAP